MAKKQRIKELEAPLFAGPRPTTQDVARLANVSLGTVSRVLNGAPSVNDELKKRVITAIDTLGFVPHALAQGLRRKSTRTIGCIMSNISFPLFSRHIAGVETALRGLDYSLLLMNSHADRATEEEAFSLVEKQRLDAVITTLANEANYSFLSRLAAVKTPCVLIERDVEGFDRVLSDHRNGVEKATRYLIGLGHKRISLITVTTDNWPGRERRIGMEQAFQAAKLPFPKELLYNEGSTAEYGYYAANQALLSKKRPTAFIVGANQMIGVLKAVKLAGLNIPKDISIVCIGNTEFNEVFTPPVTEIYWDIEMLGKMAAEIILARLSDEASTALKRLILPTQFVLRDSCAAPSKP